MPTHSSYNFFKNFPKIQYNGKLAVDLLTNVKVGREQFQNALTLEPFVVGDDDTLEGLAYWIYKDPFLFYILALLNDIEDPFNDWVCNMLELNRLVIDKYKDTFLKRHQERVLKQLKQFFFNEHRFYFTKKLTSGRYYIKLYFKDKTTFGKVRLSITDNEKIKENLKEYTDIYSNTLIQYEASESQIFLDLTSEKMATTKLFVEDEHSNVKIDLYLTQFTPFINNTLKPYMESLTLPVSKEYSIDKEKEIVLEFNNEFNENELLFYGGGGDLILEVYNAASFLIHKAETYQYIRFKDFIQSFNNFLATPEKDYENIELYAYSNKLIHSLITSIYEKQKATHFLNFSIKTLEELLIEQYQKNFSPIMYDIMSDYYNERTNSDIISSTTATENVIKVKCASTHGIDLNKKDTTSIDGIPLTSGTLILLKDQNNKKENGVYKFDNTFHLMKLKSFNYYSLMTIFVEEGLKNSATEWMLLNTDAINESTDLLFTQVYGVIFEQNSILKNLKKLQGAISMIEYHYYAQDIYNDTHHWETTTSSILQAGIEVDEDYVELVSGKNSRTRISNFEYETIMNDKKRNIKVLQPANSEMFISAFNKLLGVR